MFQNKTSIASQGASQGTQDRTTGIKGCHLLSQTSACTMRTSHWVKGITRRVLERHSPQMGIPLGRHTCYTTHAMPPSVSGLWLPGGGVDTLLPADKLQAIRHRNDNILKVKGTSCREQPITAAVTPAHPRYGVGAPGPLFPPRPRGHYQKAPCDPSVDRSSTTGREIMIHIISSETHRDIGHGGGGKPQVRGAFSK